MSTVPARRSWIGWSFFAGCGAGIPVGVILAYLAVIPFYLGLFFFLLLGLLVGATMFRFGRKAVPVRPATLRLIGAAVVLIIWTTTLVTEYATLPALAARRVEMSWIRPLKPEEKGEIARQARRHVMSQLLSHTYEGGFADWLKGFPKYLKWASRDGTMQCPRVLDRTTFTLSLRQRRNSWVFRVVLSLGLLAFAVLSQYLLLGKPPGAPSCPDDRPSDRGKEDS